MIKSKISMFDWNGELEQQVLQHDAPDFNLKFERLEGGVMGFITFSIEGTESDVEAFLSYYELELDEEEVQA